jgi:hypothetical protein
VFSDSTVRRSARNTRATTPAEQVTTMSGRQVRPPTRLNPNGEGGDGEAADANSMQEDSVRPNGRPSRAAARSHGTNGTLNSDGDVVEDEDVESSEPDDGNDEDDEHVFEESNDDEDDLADDEELLDEDLEVQGDKSFVVKLAVNLNKLTRTAPYTSPISTIESKDVDPTEDVTMEDAPVEGQVGDFVPKQLTPEPSAEAESERKNSLPTGPGAATTYLAFRGSPEKRPGELAHISEPTFRPGPSQPSLYGGR